MALPRHHLDPMLDERLVAYAARSWNAERAVYCLQQMTSLLPGFVNDLAWLRQPTGLEQAQYMWGLVADLVAAMTGLLPTCETLLQLGFDNVEEAGGMIAFESYKALAASPVLESVQFDDVENDDIAIAFQRALDHDLTAKPLMMQLQDEVRAFDETITSIVCGLSDSPTAFPTWDGRPLFIQEQQAVLLYLARNIAAEIVVDHLADEPLGAYLLRCSGVIADSVVTGEPIFDINRVPLVLLKVPIGIVCHEVGDVTLRALRAFGEQADILDVLYVVESAVKAELGIDISQALTPSRQVAMERNMRNLAASVIDLQSPVVSTLDVAATGRAELYKFPDF